MNWVQPFPQQWWQSQCNRFTSSPHLFSSWYLPLIIDIILHTYSHPLWSLDSNRGLNVSFTNLIYGQAVSLCSHFLPILQWYKFVSIRADWWDPLSNMRIRLDNFLISLRYITASQTHTISLPIKFFFLK